MQASDPLLDFASNILLDFDEHFEIVDIKSTPHHEVIKAETESSGPVCLKICSRVFTTSPKRSSKGFPTDEIEAFRLVKGVPWAPTLLACADDYSWMIRKWVGDATIDKLPPEHWTRERLKSLWSLIAQVFEFFHAMDPPVLLRDTKPQNISFDDHGFYFIDLNAAKPIEKARRSSRRPRTGTNRSLFWGPEAVQGNIEAVSVRSDYFSFATVIYFLLTRKFPWSNGKSDLEESHRQYAIEYAEATEAFEAVLRERGFSPMDRSFLQSCMHPNPDLRPERLRLPY